MASITIRNLEDDLKRRLRIRAAEHGRSMEEEAREILRADLAQASCAKTGTGEDLWDDIRALFDPLGGMEREIPPRGFGRKPPDFRAPEYGAFEEEK